MPRGSTAATGSSTSSAGRVRVAGRLLPWIANGVIEFEGKRHRLGGFSRIPSFHLQEGPSGATFKVAGGGIVVHGQIEARATQIATWRYDDPSGGAHEVRNGGIADLELTAEQTGETKSFSVAGSATYELGRREPSAPDSVRLIGRRAGSQYTSATFRRSSSGSRRAWIIGGPRAAIPIPLRTRTRRCGGRSSTARIRSTRAIGAA